MVSLGYTLIKINLGFSKMIISQVDIYEFDSRVYHSFIEVLNVH
mgnify:CR=1 FL=1